MLEIDGEEIYKLTLIKGFILLYKKHTVFHGRNRYHHFELYMIILAVSPIAGIYFCYLQKFREFFF